jgi:serine/threonine protein kinase/tetratricopeptide (TPR) repeat protein
MSVDVMQVKSIFLAAAERPAEGRAAFLDEACGGDAELRRRVERLLAAHDEPGPADGTREYVPPAEQVGAVVAGRYKLLQVIGEGGMGTVYMAEQTQPVKRMVALKLVKAGMDSRAVLARFEVERQALALMDHPNIAKVLDAGTTEREQPFFVMELVKGVPLTQFCDERQLSIADRLQIFQQVCHAVQHAHQKGIIHRDLKPSNILVESHDGRPVPKVIDFGLAKAMNALPLTDRSLFTHFGAMLGTPLYMAPEQAEFSALDVDTRADVYALGVLLYELLTGTTPLEKQRFARAARDEIRRFIQEEEPPRPSTRLSTAEARASIAACRQSDPAKLGRLVRGDLDWIVMKALAKERDRRYETANAFAQDVERYLRHEPVSAGPPTAGYRLRKFVRRNRAVVGVTCLLAGLLLLGAVGLLLGMVAVRREQQRTAAALEQVRAEQERTREALVAETTARKQALAAVDTLTNDVLENLVARHPVLRQERALLGKVAEVYSRFAAEKGVSEEARQAAAEWQFRLAKLRDALDDRFAAAAACREAIRLTEKLAADFPAVPAYRLGMANAHRELGELLTSLRQQSEAEAAFRKAVAIHEKLAKDFPGVAKYRAELAWTYVAFATFRKEEKQSRDAVELLTKAISLLEGQPAREERTARERSCLCEAYRARALILSALKRHAEAAKDWDRANELTEARWRHMGRMQRALSLARAGDHTRATAEADELTRAEKTWSVHLYDAACVYGVAVPAVSDARLKEQYAAKAVALLGRARDAGLFRDREKIEHLKQDDDLAALRGRADFQQLVRELEKALRP